MLRKLKFSKKRVQHEQIILKVVSSKNNKKIAVRLHWQINDVRELWARNKKLKEEIKLVPKNCQICKIFKKSPPTSVLGLPFVSQFQETVAMVAKQHNGEILIHLIYHLNLVFLPKIQKFQLFCYLGNDNISQSSK